jgi:Restriction endonuclease
VTHTAVTLLLNATYEPLCVVSSRRAVVLVLSQKAVPVEDGDGFLRSVSRTVPVPAVARLTRFVRVPYRAQVPLTRKAVFARDGGRCAYCGAPATSIDHVVPRSRGGQHTWDNVVASCGRCNHTKADRAISELGWRLRTVPRAPTGVSWRVLGARPPDPRWSAYLDGDTQATATATASA